jgi:transcriptional regulator MraZ
VFLGEYTHTLDEKGRLTLPARWRDELGDEVVITRGLDPCLFVFPMSKFELIAREYDQLGLGQSDARSLSRFLFAKATSDALDKQGRIIIPQSLREFAGINGEAVIAGANNRIEIWNAQRYRDLNAELESNIAEMAERTANVMQRALSKTDN